MLVNCTNTQNDMRKAEQLLAEKLHSFQLVNCTIMRKKTCTKTESVDFKTLHSVQRVLVNCAN